MTLLRDEIFKLGAAPHKRLLKSCFIMIGFGMLSAYEAADAVV